MVELRLHCPQHAVEPISDALLALDALSVSVADADAHTDQEQALFAEPGMPAPAEGWQRSHLQALFAQEVQARHAGTVLAMHAYGANVRAVVVAPLLDGLEAVGEGDVVIAMTEAATSVAAPKSITRLPAGGV